MVSILASKKLLAQELIHRHLQTLRLHICGAGPYEPGQGPPQPPSAWQHMLAGLSGVVGFFGRLSFLVDENAHAIHFFISALLQLLDRYALPPPLQNLNQGSTLVGTCTSTFEHALFKSSEGVHETMAVVQCLHLKSFSLVPSMISADCVNPVHLCQCLL